MSSRIRLFFPERLQENLAVELDIKQSHYVKNVMRLKQGDNLHLFNNKDGEYAAFICLSEGKKIKLKIIKKIFSTNVNNYFKLAFSPLKGNHLDFLIQKSTELGVHSFMPVIFDRTINRKINSERIKKIITESVEQSSQLAMPILEKEISFKKFINKIIEENSVLYFADINSNQKINNSLISKETNAYILIGPEGDFSEEETQLLKKQKNCIGFSLGKTILRAETAAIAALSIFNNIKN